MELLKTIPFGVNGREFDIEVFRDKDNDSLVLVPKEISPAKKDDVSYLKGFIHMKGLFTLQPEEYPEYEDTVAMVKGSLGKL